MLDRLHQLDWAILRGMEAWSQRFGELTVDITRMSSSPQPFKSAFVWAGRDSIERIHSDTRALARGEVHLLGAAESIGTVPSSPRTTTVIFLILSSFPYSVEPLGFEELALGSSHPSLVERCDAY